MRTFVKSGPAAPQGFFGCEAAGLQWLSAADGGVRCASVVAHDATSLTLEHITSVAPSVAAAQAFGAALARTHDAGAAAHGAPPGQWTGPGFFGPLHQPLPMSYAAHDSWGAFYARERLGPMLARARQRLATQTAHQVDEIMKRCAEGQFDDDSAPARVHGDLWSGNVMWSADGVVVIDPAAHGGHRETDLALLALFGCPHLDAVMGGYQEQHPLRAGWRSRIGLHQLYPLLAHVVLFGGGYSREVARAAEATLDIS